MIDTRVAKLPDKGLISEPYDVLQKEDILKIWDARTCDASPSPGYLHHLVLVVYIRLE